MISLGDVLNQRLQAYSKDPKGVEEAIKARGKEYNKRWNDGVGFFQKMINKERIKDGLKPIGFMPVRMKLVALRELEDLRWFYFHCVKYSKTFDKQGNKNSFSKGFWGALDVNKKR